MLNLLLAFCLFMSNLGFTSGPSAQLSNGVVPVSGASVGSEGPLGGLLVAVNDLSTSTDADVEDESFDEESEVRPSPSKDYVSNLNSVENDLVAHGDDYEMSAPAGCGPIVRRCHPQIRHCQPKPRCCKHKARRCCKRTRCCKPKPRCCQPVARRCAPVPVGCAPVVRRCAPAVPVGCGPVVRRCQPVVAPVGCAPMVRRCETRPVRRVCQPVVRRCAPAPVGCGPVVRRCNPTVRHCAPINYGHDETHREVAPYTAPAQEIEEENVVAPREASYNLPSNEFGNQQPRGMW